MTTTNTSDSPAPTISWCNLSWEVSQFSGWRWKKKSVLKNLTGSFAAGTLGGLLGASGAGKSSLLNLLSGTVTAGVADKSQICFSVPEHQQKQSMVSYYIKQHIQESIIGELTVGQILRYAFAFKNEEIGRREMEKHIAATMDALMLPAELDSRPFAKCSGGEQKRVAIAQELMSLTAPAFLYIDEPTTGLDSASAYEVMLCLQRLTKVHHITVIGSIHAPNTETLNLFDQIYVLAKGGVCIYSGPPGEIASLLQRQLNLAIAPEQPPIEVLLKIACSDTINSDILNLARNTLVQEQAKLAAYKPRLCAVNNPTPQRKCFSISNLATHLARQCRITFFAQWRTILFSPLVFLLYFTIVSTIYNLEMTTYSGCYPLPTAPNRTCKHEDRLKADDFVKMNGNFILYVTLLVGFVSLITSTLLYSSQLKTFQSEHRNHWYSVGVFYFSSSLVAFIELNITVLFVCLLSYFLSAQHAADAFTVNWNRLGFYSLFIWLLCLFNQSLGHLVGLLLIKHPTLALIFCQLLYATTCLFNGTYIKFNRTEVEWLDQLGDSLGFVYITRGLYYSIFGIDRCNPTTEYSWVLLDHNIEVDRIWYYVRRTLVNVLIVKTATFVLMYIKFNSFEFVWRKKKKFKGQSICDDNNNEILEAQMTSVVMQVPSSSTANTRKQSNNQQGRHIAIAWRNLSLYAAASLFAINSDGSNENRPLILRQLNGQFCFGTLGALMGTSGAGKSSLLRVLNGQCKTRLSDTTAIYLSKLVKIQMCFITQEVGGHLMSGLTARQAVMYASKLKNNQAGLDHEAIAIKWLNELDLANTVDTRVEYCSGGERKRLAVALELTSIEMPNLICIDEPTSGLDSNSAEIVISTLRRLTHSHPVAIVTSIHQPTTEILHHFDQLYVLARGGVCIYSGRPNAIQYSLEKVLEGIKSCPFPIETLIKYSCSSYSTPTVQNLVTFHNSQFANDHKLLHQQAQLMPDGVLPNRARFSVHSLLGLSHRYLAYIRGYLWIEWLFYFTISLAYAATLRLMFPTKMRTISGCVNLEDDLDQCTKSTKDIEEEFLLKDNLIYNYFYSIIYHLLVLLNSSFSFFSQYALFRNEHRNGWYSTGSWYLIKSIAEVVPLLPTIAIYIYILDIYEPVVPGGIYWQIVYLMLLATIGFCSMGHCFSLLAGGNVTLMTILLVTLFVLSLILDNSAIHIADMPYYWQALSHLSISRYLYSSILLLQYGFGRCAPKELQTVLSAMSVEEADYGSNVLMLIFNLVIYRVLAFVLLVKRANPVEDRQKRMARIVQFNAS